MSKFSKITLQDFYLRYPYKKVEGNPNTVPVPYVSKEDYSDHKHSLSYKQWKAIIIVYIKYLVSYILTGKIFNIPSRLGELKLVKYKPSRKRPVNFQATKETYGEINKTLPKGKKKIIYHMNHHSKGYSPLIAWDKAKVNYPYKWHWKFKLSRGNWSLISKKLLSDSTFINKIHQR